MAHLQQWVSVLSECRHSGKCLYFIWLHPCGCEWIGPRSKPPTFLSFSAPLFPPPPLFPLTLPCFGFAFLVCWSNFGLRERIPHLYHTPPPKHIPPSPPHTSPLILQTSSSFHPLFTVTQSYAPPTLLPSPTINTRVLVLHCTLLLYNSHLPSIYDPFQNPKYLQSEALWMRSQTINSIKPSFFLPGPTSTIFLLW